MAFEMNANGLGIDDVHVGSGDAARPGQRVTVHYTGWLWDADPTNPEGGRVGRKFDSSVDRNQPFEFGLGMGEVIRGWDEGVAGMRVGGRRRLLVPATMGYGARGVGGVIPPNATLLFEVELLGV
ncbi:MAG: FKBP-type peptidyl-prolyl cis-trans isomerase [Lautropia sp.]|nr:FKBP-type peptidyl-prolyl cis-trans isomerase [Lautropia sp.]